MTINRLLENRLTHQRGVTIAEVLICLALFSVAVVGIYMGSSAAQRGVAKGMKADVEAAIANMKIAEVNPYDLDVDTAYDAPATYTTGKQTYTMPSGQLIYWTRTVTSANTSGDVKQISVYLFRNASDVTPYRKFRKDVVLERQSFMLGDSGSLPAYYKDTTGTIWTRMNNNVWSNIASGTAHRAGPDQTGNGGTAPTSVNVTDATVVPFTQMWAQAHSKATTTLAYTIPGTQGQTYLVKLGFCECNGATAGQRPMNVVINGTTYETAMDVFALAGANRAMVREYKVQAINLGTGTWGLNISLVKNGGTLNPLLMNIQVERDTTQ